MNVEMLHLMYKDTGCSINLILDGQKEIHFSVLVCPKFCVRHTYKNVV